MNEKRILCVGMCVLDIIHVVSDYPVEDSDVRSNHGRWQRGGNASNNCTVLKLLGANCEFIGAFSTIPMFKFVIQDMIERGIQIENCVYFNNCEAPLSSVLLNERTGTRTIVHSNPNLPNLKFIDFQKLNLTNYKWIHFEARTVEETEQMMKMVVDYNRNNQTETSSPITISLDLEKHNIAYLRLAEMADYIFSGKDFANFIECYDMKKSVYTLRRLLTNKTNTIICPWGSNGVGILKGYDEYFEWPSYPPETIVDTLGAGDTFCAATIFSLSSSGGNNCLETAIEFGSRIAGSKIGFNGYDRIKQL